MNITDLKPGAHIHMMGICGTAMGSLAGLLVDRGFKVTGSDQNVYPPMSTQLQKIGIQIREGYKKENLLPRPDLVIVGNVISKTFEEAQALLQTDIPYTSLPKAMGELVIANRHSLVIAGTHGKTTTTSLMAWIAQNVAANLGGEPGFMIGGIPKNFGQSYQLAKGDFFVIEGDEYDTAFFDKVPKFTHYRPRSVILTSVEFDHADIYRDLDHVKEAFTSLLKMIPANGHLITNAEDPNIASILTTRAPVHTFGLKKGDYRAQNIAPLKSGGQQFEIVYKGEILASIRTQMIGDYNVRNILAAFALSEQLHWDRSKVIAAIESFAGVKRRQEVIGQPGGITLIEDFAHHPTAVKETIVTVQNRYPQAQVFSIFEPRSATSRRKVFQDDYLAAFSVAQHVLMPPAFNQTNIPEAERFSVEELVAELQSRGVKAQICPSVDEIVQKVKAQARSGDVVLIMSNGGFGGIYQKLQESLSA
jgi:UDP-N-acetylmuramate: L-alanyl-gamma-D-glutamyl-meso-diaminopimelate ligase